MQPLKKKRGRRVAEKERGRERERERQRERERGKRGKSVGEERKKGMWNQ